MGEDGLLKLTNLAISSILTDNNAQNSSGTPGYTALEVLCHQNHGLSVDFFALGVIGYECMFGKRPYVGTNRKEIRDIMIKT